MKKDERFVEILKHAAKVFYDKGYDRASIRDISAEADMSLAGLYYYFRSKEELLHLVLERIFSELLDGVRADLQVPADPPERLRRFIRLHIGYFVTNFHEMKVLSHDYEALTGEAHEKIRKLRREYYEVAEGIIADALADRPGSAVTPRIAALGLFGMMNWLYTWYRPERDGGAEEIARQMTALFLSGLLPDRS